MASRVPDRNKRRALGDIGNLIIRGVYAKPQHDSRHPESNKKKKSEIIYGAALGPVRKIANYKPLQKDVVAVKPIPETAVFDFEINLDAEEANKENPRGIQESSSAGKDVLQTSTSVSSSASTGEFASCGLADETKNGQIEDIDAGDVGNQLAAVEYVGDLYRFYKLAETSIHIHDYMDSQSQINENMRMILVDWLIEVHHMFKLSPETLYLTIQIIDRYLSVHLVQRKELQLLGISSMLIASKYEEIWAPKVSDLVDITERAYNKEQVLGMEKSILANLGWSLTLPTPYVFLVRFVKAARADEEMENMVFFLAELGLMQYGMVEFCPSMLAASAVYAARCTLNKTPLWDETLQLHTGYSESQLIDCAKQLVSFHSGSAGHKLKVVYRKYSASERCGVALRAPAKML